MSEENVIRRICYGRGRVRILEIGTAEGVTTLRILKHMPKVPPTGDSYTLYACDPFIPYGEKHDRDHDKTYDIFMEKTRKYRENGSLQFKREKSFDFLISLLNDKKNHKSFDFIYIDGNHTSRFVIEDFLLSYPLAKKGAIFAMDDYFWKNKYVENDDPVNTPKMAIDCIERMFDGKIKKKSRKWGEDLWLKTAVIYEKIS